MIVKKYQTSRGRSPIDDFIENLPKDGQAEIYAVLEDVEEQGTNAPLVSMRQIRGKLWEIRISQSRIFYVVIQRDIMVLLHAYKKQGGKAPSKEIDTALRRLAEIEGR